LLLEATREDTHIIQASQDDQVMTLLKGGERIAGAVLPRTAPHDAQQLALFGE
jgi:hypothetical protein